MARDLVCWTIGALLMSATPAIGKTLTVKVDAQAMPWSIGANPKLRYGWGKSYGKAARVVFDPTIGPGSQLYFKASGYTTTYSGDNQQYGPEGANWATGDQGGLGTFPSAYVKPKARQARLNMLIGAFIDADGTVVGSPFLIGAQATVTVPPGAAALSLGINDDRYDDNGGELTVVIETRTPEVHVEPADEK